MKEKEYCEHYDFDCKKEEMTCEGCGYYKKSADEMFEDLNYEIIIRGTTKIQYKYMGKFFDKEIIFELLDKRVVVELNTGESAGISMQELQAINKKVEELGWK